ncbi:hypothetical protein HR060_07735 [Catenovulum sp. SM1970]|uniref:heme biosynthesis protein HemY n=1 Tax=Marinifaba aquimaris TaxID=2741323 RepID=UPI0015748D0F|nr:heme biosynthesis HemY N-terminal domain-containing protein [Marinifaba aquimaris]NTS76759.1 hypothetical protein [Marinifaba aquimaris]
MIKLILFFIFLFGLLFMGSTWIGEKGRVIILMGEWTIETSVVGGCVILLLAYALLHLAVVLVKYLFQLRNKNRQWRHNRLQNRIQIAIQQSLDALFKQNYALAEKLSVQKLALESGALKANNLDKALNKTQYLIAAEAAKNQQKFTEYSQYQLRATEYGSEFEKQLAMAQSLQAEGKIDKALAAVEKLKNEQPKNGLVIAALANLYQQANLFDALADLLPKVIKLSDLPKPILLDFIESTYSALYQNDAKANDVKALNKHHKAMLALMPEAEQFEFLYINALISAGAKQDAENYLIKAVKKGVSPVILSSLRQLTLAEPIKLISQLEKLVKQDNNQYTSLAALGYVAAASRDWDLAKKALEAAIKLNPTSQDYQLLGQTLEQLSLPEQALACYRKGLSMAQST